MEADHPVFVCFYCSFWRLTLTMIRSYARENPNDKTGGVDLVGESICLIVSAREVGLHILSVIRKWQGIILT